MTKYHPAKSLVSTGDMQTSKTNLTEAPLEPQDTAVSTPDVNALQITETQSEAYSELEATGLSTTVTKGGDRPETEKNTPRDNSKKYTGFFFNKSKKYFKEDFERNESNDVLGDGVSRDPSKKKSSLFGRDKSGKSAEDAPFLDLDRLDSKDKESLFRSETLNSDWLLRTDTLSSASIDDRFFSRYDSAAVLDSRGSSIKGMFSSQRKGMFETQVPGSNLPVGAREPYLLLSGYGATTSCKNPFVLFHNAIRRELMDYHIIMTHMFNYDLEIPSELLRLCKNWFVSFFKFVRFYFDFEEDYMIPDLFLKPKNVVLDHPEIGKQREDLSIQVWKIETYLQPKSEQEFRDKVKELCVILEKFSFDLVKYMRELETFVIAETAGLHKSAGDANNKVTKKMLKQLSKSPNEKLFSMLLVRWYYKSSKGVRFTPVERERFIRSIFGFNSRFTVSQWLINYDQTPHQLAVLGILRHQEILMALMARGINPQTLRPDPTAAPKGPTAPPLSARDKSTSKEVAPPPPLSARADLPSAPSLFPDVATVAITESVVTTEAAPVQESITEVSVSSKPSTLFASASKTAPKRASTSAKRSSTREGMRKSTNSIGAGQKINLNMMSSTDSVASVRYINEHM